MPYFFQWIHIPGKLKWISSGRNVVIGVNSGNNIYYRKGMSSGRPTGTGWVHIPGKLMMVEIYENQVVGTNSGHAIYKCPVSGVPAPKGGIVWGSSSSGGNDHYSTIHALNTFINSSQKILKLIRFL